MEKISIPWKTGKGPWKKEFFAQKDETVWGRWIYGVA